jgi:hypothetical protein
MIIDTQAGTGGMVVSINGAAFDFAAVEHLHNLLLELDPAQPLTIDFRSVRIIHDTAVARLAHDLLPAFTRVLLLGLGEHHRRLMRYFARGGPGDAPGHHAASP